MILNRIPFDEVIAGKEYTILRNIDTLIKETCEIKYTNKDIIRVEINEFYDGIHHNTAFSIYRPEYETSDRHVLLAKL